MTGEGERLRVERGETQVDTPLAIHLHRVQQIILIVIRPDLGERADKTLQEKRDVVLEKIDLAESLLQELLHAVAGEHLVHAGGMGAPHHALLRPGLAPIIHRLYPLALGKR